MQADERRSGGPDPLMFGVGQTQTVAQPLRVLRDRGAKRGEPQDRVGPTTAIRLDRDQTAEASRVGEAAEDRLEKTAFPHRLDDLAGARGRDELYEFGAHPLPGQAREAFARPDRSGKTLGVEPVRGEPGREPEEPQNAQIILTDALVGVADEAHASGGKIIKSADRIVDRSVGSKRQRVDGEVAPLGVGGEVASERHLGPATVGLDVLAQRRRLDRASVDDERHRPVGDAGQRDLEPRRPCTANHLVGRCRGREVEIEPRLAEREVAHRAADQARLLAFAVEGFERPRQRALPERRKILELAVRQAAEDRHSIRPGMRTPFSTCAGT